MITSTLLYIDPGTGSMLFTILLSLIGAAIYSIRMLVMKFRNGLLGKGKDVSEEVIPFVIYSDDKRYWNVFEPIVKEMDARNIEVVYLTASDDDPVFKCSYSNVKAKCIGKDNKSFAYLNNLKATILLSTTPGLDVYQWKRSKNVKYYVHILHSAGEIVMYRMFGIDYYDAILTSGDYHEDDVRALEALRSLPKKEIVKVGLPFMDVMADRFEGDNAPEHDERTVLLAPSWGKSSLLNVYGDKVIDLLIATGYNIIIRPHPQSFTSEKELIEGLMAKYPENDKFKWNRDNDNYQVLKDADILVSDFSGVIYDFSLVYDKPVIYTNPNADVSIYDAWWLNKPLWKTTALPRLGCELTKDNIENIKDLIDSCIEDTKYAQGRNEVREETWAYKGEGAKRVADYLENKYVELTRKEN